MADSPRPSKFDSNFVVSSNFEFMLEMLDLPNAGNQSGEILKSPRKLPIAVSKAAKNENILSGLSIACLPFAKSY